MTTAPDHACPAGPVRPRRALAQPSPRRAAMLLSAALSLAALLGPQPAQAAAPNPADKPNATQLKTILQSAPGKPSVHGYVVDLDSGAVVLDLGGAVGITPASVSKMFTTATAALTLPMNERLVTRVLASPVKKGKVRAVALVGGGDMSLKYRHLAKLADAVAKAGVRRVGTLVADTTLFDRAAPRGFNEKLTDSSYRAPVDALNVDQGTVVIAALRGPKLGAPPVIQITPPSAAIVVDNTAKMVKGKTRGLRIRTVAGKGGKTRVEVRGVMGMKRARIVAGRRRVENAALHAGHAFLRMLKDRDIRVGRLAFASATRGRFAKGLKELASHRSESLYGLMRFCNRFSHNGYAETFFKLIGARVIGAPGTCAKGEAAVRKTFAQAGIDWSTVRLGNGSGLYHANKFTAKSVVQLLTAMHKAGKKGQRWRQSLAIGGAEGTLRRRLHGAATYRKIFAKTGTLDDVTALAGYAFGQGRRYAFALFYNRVKGPAYRFRRVHDRFLTALLDPTGRLTPPKVNKPVKKAKSPRKRGAKRPAKPRKRGKATKPRAGSKRRKSRGRTKNK